MMKKDQPLYVLNVLYHSEVRYIELLYPFAQEVNPLLQSVNLNLSELTPLDHPPFLSLPGHQHPPAELRR